jgi:hypothetical protein
LIAASPVAAIAEDQIPIPWGNKFFVPKDPPPVVVHDFGTVPWGTTLTHRFPLTNLYAVPMQIVKDPEVSCGCTRVVRYTQKLEPRESGFIEVEMDGRQFQGAKTVNIQVRFGPKYQSTAILQVRAFARTDVTIKPGLVNFNTVALGQQPKSVIDIQYSGTEFGWNINSAVDTSNAPSVKADIKMQPLQRGIKTYQLEVELKPNAAPGVLQEQILLKTTDPSCPVLTIPVAGVIKAPLTVVQGELVKLNTVAVGQETARRITVVANKEFTVTRVEGQGDGLVVQFSRYSRASQVLTISFKPTQPGELRRRLTIVTDQKESVSVVVEATAEAAVP